jgi:hypothetical protein
MIFQANRIQKQAGVDIRIAGTMTGTIHQDDIIIKDMYIKC